MSKTVKWSLSNDQAYWLDQLWYGIHGRDDNDGLVIGFSDLRWEDLYFMAQNILVDGTYDRTQRETLNKVRKLVLERYIDLDLNGYEASETSWLEPYCDND